MSAMRPVRISPTLIAIPALAAAVVFVLRGDGRAGFWVNHPMLGALTAGALLFLFGVLVIDRLVKYREHRRWRSVARLACNTLGDELTRSIVTSLAVLWQPRSTKPLPREVARAGWRTHELRPSREIRHVPVGRDRVKVLDVRSDLAASGPRLDLAPQQRLVRLMLDLSWRAWTAQHLRELRTGTRELLAGWSVVLLSADRPRDLLDRTAQLIDQLGYLREGLEKMSGVREPRQQVAMAVQLTADWQQILDVRARMLTNALWAEADQEHYAFVLPEGVPADLPDMQRGATQLGSWSPNCH